MAGKEARSKDSLVEHLSINNFGMLIRSLQVFEIRQAEESDIPDLVALDDKCFNVYYYENTKFNRSDFQSYFRLRNPILLVATRDICLVGYIAGRVRYSEGLHIAHLDSIAVSSAEQRKGLGSDLLQHFIEQANRWACKTVLLEVAKANEKGLDFFLKWGFQSIVDLPEYYGRDIDGVLMEMSI